ncbi:MAG: SRPBCC domain-containing protein [Candidatus Limnocylindrales bacterium]
MRDARVLGTLLAFNPPQHVSFSFDWDGDPIGQPTVVALDTIDHGNSTHLTIRHVGLPGGRQRELHVELWRYRFQRLVRVAGQPGAGYREAAARS